MINESKDVIKIEKFKLINFIILISNAEKNYAQKKKYLDISGQTPKKDYSYFYDEKKYCAQITKIDFDFSGQKSLNKEVYGTSPMFGINMGIDNPGKMIKVGDKITRE
ncbi:hypothetical protein BpHYR1_044952 [Brachionus plicatilis]|uniref:Uncharacterized protein n=1 Tax=Brachionus plicatilis TaxID=10195 RepID=A0A3M7S0F2_BRAPC|nr:hypothetical protein BpHYR1_044952 [Brachionus plicatilis]